MQVLANVVLQRGQTKGQDPGDAYGLTYVDAEGSPLAGAA